jgi:hypothetical protein
MLLTHIVKLVLLEAADHRWQIKNRSDKRNNLMPYVSTYNFVKLTDARLRHTMIVSDTALRRRLAPVINVTQADFRFLRVAQSP